MERTLVLIKPDGIERKLMGNIISIYEEKGLEIVALKLIKADRKTAEAHYEEHKGRAYFNELIDYITEDKLCAIILQGDNVVEVVRHVNGDKDPLKAELATIRGKYSNDKTRNLVHASDSSESAEREIKIWFGDEV